MSELTVTSAFGDYTIEIAVGSLERAGSAALAIVDPAVADRSPFPTDRMIPVVGSESAKTLAECERVLGAMKNAGLTRGETVAALGGGVVQDVATLTSSLYMRGVPWIYVPTTLMAMADSCIGGKSSINAGGVKNLVGNFYPPKHIIVDPTFVTTLPRRAIVSGLSEAVKICFARGRSSFEEFLRFDAAYTPGADEGTVDLITHVLSSKKWFVEIDELDRAERQLLNFGHSFGHAWESACGYRVQHGIGVAVGMLAAIRHPASAKNDLTQRLAQYCSELLESVRDDLTAAQSATDWDVFTEALRGDKKNSPHELRLVLPGKNESVTMTTVELSTHQLKIAREAIELSLEELTK